MVTPIVLQRLVLELTIIMLFKLNKIKLNSTLNGRSNFGRF